MNNFNTIAIFCEDVRPEVSGQESIVGIFGDGLSVSSVPGFMPKLSIYIRFNAVSGFELGSLSFKMLSPNGNVLFENIVGKDVISRAIEESAAANMATVGIKTYSTFAPFQINEVGTFSVIASINEVETLAGFIKVSLVENLL